MKALIRPFQIIQGKTVFGLFNEDDLEFRKQLIGDWNIQSTNAKMWFSALC